MSAGLQVAPEVGVVIDLAVEHNPNRPVFVRERLLARLEIDDAEATMREGGLSVQAQARFVRTAMCDDVAHPQRASARIGVERRR